MKRPSKEEVDAALNRIEAVKMSIDFISDADRLGLPRVNVRHSNKPVLRVDEVLRRSERDPDGSQR